MSYKKFWHVNWIAINNLDFLRFEKAENRKSRQNFNSFES